MMLVLLLGLATFTSAKSVERVNEVNRNLSMWDEMRKDMHLITEPPSENATGLKAQPCNLPEEFLTRTHRRSACVVYLG
eukprot:97150-Amorphochlora_amoeboformis.AAC.3